MTSGFPFANARPNLRSSVFIRRALLLTAAASLVALAAACGDDGDGRGGADVEADVQEDTVGDTCVGGECGDTSRAETGGGSDTGGDAGDGGDPGSCEARELPALTATSIAPGASFDQPLYMTQPPGESETLFVVERAGRILRVRDGEVQSPPFLDIRDSIEDGFGEQGLLGLAFHPDYQQNGRFFVFYTAASGGANVVAEYRRESSDPDVADPGEVRRLLEVSDTQDNHNGGMMTFGPDGRLYVAMGDGGGACDQGGGQHSDEGNGQDTSNLFGTILRLDVDAADREFAASDNPFVGGEGRDQIWAYGLRNPWRFSFDAETGDMYIADVGQDVIEEVDVLPAGTGGGQNYGWRGFEGSETSDVSGCPTDVVSEIDDHVPPIFEYRQGREEGVTIRNGASITGGYVYRGDSIPGLRGYYLYGDFVSDDIAALRYCDGEVVDNERLSGLVAAGDGLASFARDNAGELYLVYLSSGEILKIEEDS